MLPSPHNLTGIHGWRTVTDHLFPHLGHQSLTEAERMVLDELHELGRADTGTLAEATKLSEAAVRSALEGLESRRMAMPVREGADRWELSGFHARLMRAWKSHIPLDRLKRSLLGGMSQYVGLQLASLGLAYVTQIVLARWLGTEDFGFVSLAVTLAVVLSNVANLGFPTGVGRFLPQYAEDESWDSYHGLLRRGIQLPAVAGCLLAAIGVPIVFATGLPTVEKYALSMGLALVPILAVSGMFSGVLQSLKRIVAAYLPDDVVAPVLVVVGAVIMHMLFDDLSAIHVLGVMLAVHVTILVVQAVWVRRALPAAYFQSGVRYRTKEWMGTTIPVMVMTLFAIVIYRADLLLVAHMLGTGPAGIYAVVLSTAELFQIFLKGARSVAGPYISPFVRKGDTRSFQRLMTLVARYAFIPTLLGTAVCALFGGQILDLFGPGFDQGYTALLIMLAAQLVRAAIGGPGIVMLYSGHQKRVAQVYAVVMLLDLALLFALVPEFGMVGASLASFTTVTISQLALSVLANRETGVITSILGRHMVDEALES